MFMLIILSLCVCTRTALGGNIDLNETVGILKDKTHCKWTSTLGYELDLSRLDGATIIYTNTSNHDKYLYTPCDNGVICDQNDTNLATMALQQNVNGFCIAYLAKFTNNNSSNAVIPTYSTVDKTFTFIYNNGEISGICSEARELIIKWHCTASENENMLYKVKSVNEIASCVYMMEIDSHLACPVTHNMTTTTTTSTTTTTEPPGDCEFGMFITNNSDDSTVNTQTILIDNNQQRWKWLTYNELLSLKNEFITFYNDNNGIPVIIGSFNTTNCCFRLFDDENEIGYLAIGKESNYIVPGRNDSWFCDPPSGYMYGESFYFYGPSTQHYYDYLSTSNTFFNVSYDCYSINNPGIYAKDCF